MAKSLNDEKIEKLLIDFLRKGPLPCESLMRLAIPWAQLDVLQAERVLEKVRKRGMVELDGGWVRLLDEK